MGFDGTHYSVKNKDIPRVTHILGVLEKPFLARWQINQMGEYIVEEFFAQKADGNSSPDIKELVRKGKGAADVKRNEAADRGKEIHTIFENIIRGVDINYSGEYDKMVANFEKWIEENDVRNTTTELFLQSTKHNYGGTADLICDFNDFKNVVVDFKTGKSVYDTHQLQMAAYAMAFEEMRGKMPEQAFVLHVTPAGNLIKKLEMDQLSIIRNFRLFMKVKALWEWRHGV